CGNWSRDQEALRQQHVESRAPQRSVAVPAARRPGARLHDGTASRLPHAVRPSREDQLREDGKDRAVDPPGELEPGERNRAPEEQRYDFGREIGGTTPFTRY